MSIILSYIFYFIAASAAPLQRRWLSLKKDVSNKSQIGFSFIVMLFLVGGSLFLPLFSPFYLKGSPIFLFLLALCCGLFGAINFVAVYTAQRYVDAGISSVVLNIYTPFTIILSSLLLHESLTTPQIFGTILLLVGMVIVSKKHRIGRFKFDRYFTLMVVGSLMMAFVLVAERTLQKTTGFSAGTMISWWSQCAFLGIATLISRSKNEYSKKDTVITGTLRFFQALSWVVLLNVVGNLSIVSSVTTFKIVVVFIGAAIFLKEREDFGRKILGSIIAITGLLLMK